MKVDPKSHDEVHEMIQHLKFMRISIPEFSSFGGPNHEKIDVQIEILSRECGAEEIEDEALRIQTHYDLHTDEIMEMEHLFYSTHDWMTGAEKVNYSEVADEMWVSLGRKEWAKTETRKRKAKKKDLKP